MFLTQHTKLPLRCTAFTSIKELLPTSRAYGKGHDSIFGMVAGMAVMAVSLLLMQ